MDTSSEANKLASNMLTMLTGEKWKKVRSMMSPAFTSGKLKAMAPLINKVLYTYVCRLANALNTTPQQQEHKIYIGMVHHQVAKELTAELGAYAKTGEEFSAKETLTSFTLDCIASCGFGVEANSFKEPNGIFRRMVLIIMRTLFMQWC